MVRVRFFRFERAEERGNFVDDRVHDDATEFVLGVFDDTGNTTDLLAEPGVKLR